MVIEKHLSGQKVIVPYVEDTNSDILEAAEEDEGSKG